MRIYKNDGSLWERVIQIQAAAQRITCAKFEQKTQMGHKVRSFVDFAFGIDGRVVFTDAKVTKDRLWNLKEYVIHPKKIHQFRNLLSAHEIGNVAGYLVWFQDYQKVSWVPVQAVRFAMDQHVSSLHPGSELVVSLDFKIELGQIDLRKLIFNEDYFGQKDKD